MDPARVHRNRRLRWLIQIVIERLRGHQTKGPPMYFDVCLGWRGGGEHRHQLDEATTNTLLRDWRLYKLVAMPRELQIRSYPTRIGQAVIDLAALAIVIVAASEAPHLDPVVMRIAADLLDLAADEFANHGCNDYELPNTPEYYAFAKRLIATTDDPNDVPCLGSNGQIWLQNDMAMGYCAKVLRDVALAEHLKGGR